MVSSLFVASSTMREGRRLQQRCSGSPPPSATTVLWISSPCSMMAQIHPYSRLWRWSFISKADPSRRAGLLLQRRRCEFLGIWPVRYLTVFNGSAWEVICLSISKCSFSFSSSAKAAGQQHISNLTLISGSNIHGGLLILSLYNTPASCVVYFVDDDHRWNAPFLLLRKQ